MKNSALLMVRSAEYTYSFKSWTNSLVLGHEVNITELNVNKVFGYILLYRRIWGKMMSQIASPGRYFRVISLIPADIITWSVLSNSGSKFDISKETKNFQGNKNFIFIPISIHTKKKVKT